MNSITDRFVFDSYAEDVIYADESSAVTLRDREYPAEMPSFTAVESSKNDNVVVMRDSTDPEPEIDGLYAIAGFCYLSVILKADDSQ